MSWASYQIRKIVGAHAPGMSETFSPPPRVSDLDMHHGTWMTHVPWCMRGSLTSGFLWSRLWRKRSWHSRRIVEIRRSYDRFISTTGCHTLVRCHLYIKPGPSVEELNIDTCRVYPINSAHGVVVVCFVVFMLSGLSWWRHQMETFSTLLALCAHRWIPHTKVSDAKLWCFLWSAHE